jgi:hypothetical protein
MKNSQHLCITHGCAEAYKKFLKTGSVTNLQKNYSEDLPNSAEELRQRIRNRVASLIIIIHEIRNSFKELRYRVELCAKNGGELI